MAFYVAQLRKESNNLTNTYMTPIEENIENSTMLSPDPFYNPFLIDENNNFSDFALSGTFEMGQVYYLRFKIHKVPQYYYSGQADYSNFSFSQADILNFRLLLKNDGQTDEELTPPEQIGTFSVPQALYNESNSYASYSFVFTPSKTFNRLVFRLNRIGFDKLIEARNWLIQSTETKTVSRYNGNSEIDITVRGERISYTEEDGDICILNNILSLSEASKYWIKLGFQSRPGSLIVVNGEPIRVGRSGIYELNNGTKIESFMIASPNGSNNEKIDAFLLDYAYTGAGS